MKKINSKQAMPYVFLIIVISSVLLMFGLGSNPYTEISYDKLKNIPSDRGDGKLGSSGK